MGFQSGSQIRPELGALDYSGYTNAAAINAQAMANLGKQVGGAISDYRQKKEEKQLTEQAANMVLSFAGQNPEAAGELGVKDLDTAKIAVKSLGGAAQALNTMSTLEANQVKLGALKQKSVDQQAALKALELAYPATAPGEVSQFDTDAFIGAFRGLGGEDMSVAADALAIKTASPKSSAMDNKIRTVMQANPEMSYTDAANIVTGVVKTVTDPTTGTTSSVNQAEGTTTSFKPSEDQELPKWEIEPVAPEESLYNLGSQYTGIIESAKRTGQKLTGQAGFDVATEGSIQAQQTIKTAVGDLVRAFREGGRYVKSEDEQLREELNISIGPTVDAKTYQNKLKSINKSLDRRFQVAKELYENPGTPAEDRKIAYNRALAITEFKAKLGVPEDKEKEPSDEMNIDDIDKELESLKEFLPEYADQF